jgi:uncharacterized protein YpuA (DUF1002 family)
MPNEENIIPHQIKSLSKEEAAKRGKVGGLKSAQSRRHKRKLADRIKLALQIATQQNLNQLKKQIKELLPNRHLKNNKEELKILIAQAKTVKECGIDLYQIISVAQSPMSDTSDRLKAINMVWDREEGKPLTKNENREVKEFSDEIEFLD